MAIRSFYRGALLGFWLSLVFAVSFCHGTDKTVEVVGMSECADCAKSNIKTTNAFSGLQVTVDCKTANGELKTRAYGELQGDGKFKVSLPKDMVKDGELKEECYAQLHGGSAAPCPNHSGLEAMKIVPKPTTTDEKHTFSTAGKLKFSPETCTSAYLWPHFKHKPYKKKFKFLFPVPPPEKPQPEPKPQPVSPPDDKPKPKPQPNPEPEPKDKKPQPKPEPKDKPEPKEPCPFHKFPKFPKYPKFPKFPPKHYDHPNFPPFPPYPSHP